MESLSLHPTGPYNACSVAVPTPASNSAKYVKIWLTEFNRPLDSEPRLTSTNRGNRIPAAIITAWFKIPNITLYALRFAFIAYTLP